MLCAGCRLVLHDDFNILLSSFFAYLYLWGSIILMLLACAFYLCSYVILYLVLMLFMGYLYELRFSISSYVLCGCSFSLSYLNIYAKNLLLNFLCSLIFYIKLPN